MSKASVTQRKTKRQDHIRHEENYSIPSCLFYYARGSELAT